MYFVLHFELSPNVLSVRIEFSHLNNHPDILFDNSKYLFGFTGKNGRQTLERTVKLKEIRQVYNYKVYICPSFYLF